MKGGLKEKISQLLIFPLSCYLTMTISVLSNLAKSDNRSYRKGVCTLLTMQPNMCVKSNSLQTEVLRMT